MAYNLRPWEVYPNGQWVPCKSAWKHKRSSGSPKKDGINLEKYVHPSKRWKYRSYPGIRDFEGATMSQHPPPPLPKSEKRIEEERIDEERKQKLAEKIRNYDSTRYNMPNVTQHPENTLFVARLDYKTTTETLVKEFGKFGDLVDVKLVTNREGRSRGYAFIEFSTQDGVKNVLNSLDVPGSEEKKKMKIDEREVLLDMEVGRLEELWLPRRLGGGSGVKPKKASKKTKKKRRMKKKKKAQARKVAVSGNLNAGAKSKKKQRSPKQKIVDISKVQEAVSFAEKVCQEQITAGESKNVSYSNQPDHQIASTSHQSSNAVAQNDGEQIPPANGVQSQHPKQVAVNKRKKRKTASTAENNCQEQSSAVESRNVNHPSQPEHQIGSTFHHQNSNTVPRNYGEQIPTAIGVQLQQPHQPSHISLTFETDHFQQPVTYNYVRVQGNSNAPPVNYYNQPTAGFAYQPYSNFNYSSYENPAHQFQNFEAPMQDYQFQPPHLVQQPAYSNFSYPPSNWQPHYHMPTLPQDNYQDPTMFHQAQQSVPQISPQAYLSYHFEHENHHVHPSVPQISSQAYPNYHFEHRNHHAHRSHSSAFYTGTNYHVPGVRYVAPQMYPPY